MPNPVTFTNLDVMSQALSALGEHIITDIESPEPRVTIMVTNYNAVKYFCLTKSNWRSLTIKAALNRLSSGPINRYTYAFQLPSDCLKVLTTWPISDYQLMNRQLYSNSMTVQLDYIRNLEEAYWPAWLQRYVVAELVMRTCKGITGDDPSAAMVNERDTALIDAYFQDAQQQPNQTLMANDFVDCRH